MKEIRGCQIGSKVGKVTSVVYVDGEVEEERGQTGGRGRRGRRGGIKAYKYTEGGREKEMEGMIMSGNVWLSIGICTPINNGLSQSTACRHRVHTHSLALAHIAKFSIASDFQHSVYNSILFSSSTEYAGVLCSLVFMLRLFLVFTVRGSLLMTLHCVC